MSAASGGHGEGIRLVARGRVPIPTCGTTGTASGCCFFCPCPLSRSSLYLPPSPRKCFSLGFLPLFYLWMRRLKIMEASPPSRRTND